MDESQERRLLRGIACPKIPYASHADALAALRVIRSQRRYRNGPTRAYKCRCQRWHLTSQT